MKAYVITLKGNDYSEEVANRCIVSAKKFGLTVEPFYGVDKYIARDVMKEHKLKWTWAGPNNDTKILCPISGLQMFPYTAKDINAKIGCSMSHFLMWKKCVELDEPILILEHDTVFLRPLLDFEFKGICQINDPAGATRKGAWWSQQMKKRNKSGVFPKTKILGKGEELIPDGLAGNSAYCVKPFAAQALIDKFYELGVWPNDATMNIQLFPYLEEYYPFITKAQQGKSTTTT